eukprot:30446-Pelagococcus_subviridis.AAC.3
MAERASTRNRIVAGHVTRERCITSQKYPPRKYKFCYFWLRLKPKISPKIHSRRRGRAINRNGSGNVINPAAYVTGSSPPFSRIRRRSPGDNSNSKLRRIAAKSVLGPFRTSERRGGVERRQKRR